MESHEMIIGIDLGTTNSVVAITEGGEPIVIRNQEGTNKTPSVVAFLDDDECVVGEIARRQAATNPDRTISSIKRLMGRSFDEIEEIEDRLPYNVLDHDGKVIVDVDGMGYSPEQISALILRKLKESAESYLGSEVKKAVITVPAHFNDDQRTATKAAAQLAGLEVLRLINEPTAAALAYGFGKEEDVEETIAVYDFGGGTFDITILEISGKAFEVLTSTGDSTLGGDDIDDLLVDEIVRGFEEQHGFNLTEDPVTLRRLKEVVEKAKCDLSSTMTTMITLPFIAYKDGQPLHLERQLSREEFEELIEPLVEKTIHKCQEAIDEAGLKQRNIDKVIMVGGSTRIPLVQDLVDEFFEIQPFKGVNPDEVVAQGAATQAGIFSGNMEEVVLIDVAPHSLGIEVKGNKTSQIIEKNSPIPHKAAKNFTTTEDDQTFVVVHVLQGEEQNAAENRSLGKFMLSDIPPQAKGRPRIKVTFFMNADGVMEISAEDLGSGVAKTLTIVHNDLDDEEKKARKRARRRRGGSTTGSPGKRGRKKAKRYSATSTGGGVPIDHADASDESSSDHKRRKRGKRRADSSVVPIEPEAPRKDADFSVLGDTNPGLTPATDYHERPSSEAIPLRERQSEKKSESSKAGEVAPEKQRGNDNENEAAAYAEPPRYGRQRSPENSPVPLDEKQNRQNDPPIHPEVSEEQVTETNYPKDEYSGTQVMKAGDEPPTGSADLAEPTASITHEDAPTMAADESLEESVEWPDEIQHALEAIHANDNSSALGDDVEFQKALELIESGDYASDGRFMVQYARCRLYLAARKKSEFSEVFSSLVSIATISHAQYLMPIADSAVEVLGAPEVFRRFRSILRERIGDLEGACEDLEVTSKADPQEGDREKLEDLYKARIDRSTDPAAQFKLVRLYLKSNEVDEAIELLQDLVHNDLYETRALKILGLCHWQKNLHFLAWQKFKQLKQTDEIREILYRLGNDMENTGQLQNAIAVFEHVSKESPDYRDVNQKLKKLRYRVKIQQDESKSEPAQILDDPRFTILEEINRGSMGIIYRAQDKTLEEEVALKVLNDYLCSDPSAVERFKREARAARKLAHPYIVRIHDLFESGNKRFISMEHIEGTDFKRMLAEQTRFHSDQLVYYLLQICDALSYAHKLNIIHRDIKPANVMVTRDNAIKVTDFGIAKILKSDDSTKSGTAVIGTPLYMAPEQITGEGVDARTDIYALGIMMYELVSGQPPFYLGNIEYHHIHTPPPPLPESVPEKLRDIIMKCVEKNRENRYQSVDNLYDDLRNM